MSVTVRPATPADVATLGRFGALLVRVHYGFDPLRFVAPPPHIEQLYADFLAAQMNGPASFVLVAERDGLVVGYTYAGVEGSDYQALRGPAGVLYDILVDPGERGHGVGRALLDAALAALKNRGAPRIVLMTAEQNTTAQHLFASAGFRRTMIEMTRELDGGASS